MTDNAAKPLKDLAKREVVIAPSPGKGIALDHISLIPAEAMGSGSTGQTSLFLRGDRSWATVPAGGGGGSYAIVASNTTFANTTVSMSGFGAATVNTAANLIRISVPTQTAQTGISGIANSQTTYTSGTVSLSEQANITINSSVNGASQFYRFSVAAQTGTQFSAGLSNIGNTQGDTGTVAGRLVFAGGANITLSGSTNGVSETITVIGGAGGGGGIQALVVSNTTYTQATQTITGSNMVTVKSSALGAGIIIDATQSVQTQNLVDVTLAGNTAGALALISSGTMTLAGGNNITLSQAGNAITISGANTAGGGGGGESYSMMEWPPGHANQGILATNMTAISRTPIFFPVDVPGQITLGSVGLAVSRATSGSDSMTIRFGVYTISNATRASLLGSASDSYSVTNTASNSDRRYIWLTSPGTEANISTLSRGNYVFAFWFDGGATASFNYSLRGISTGNAHVFGQIFPGNDQESTGASHWFEPFFGRWSATTAGLPGAADKSAFLAQGSAGANMPLNPIMVIRGL